MFGAGILDRDARILGLALDGMGHLSKTCHTLFSTRTLTRDFVGLVRICKYLAVPYSLISCCKYLLLLPCHDRGRLGSSTKILGTKLALGKM